MRPECDKQTMTNQPDTGFIYFVPKMNYLLVNTDMVVVAVVVICGLIPVTSLLSDFIWLRTYPVLPVI